MSIFTEKYCSELLEQQSSEKGTKLGEIILPDNEPKNARHNNGRYDNIRFKHTDNLEIWVYPNDNGKIPHFHVKRDGKPDACIMIMDNQYFTHGSHTGTLNKNEAGLLNNWLSQIVKKTGTTMWTVIRDDWNANDERGAKVPISVAQPDYSYIKPYKG